MLVEIRDDFDRLARLPDARWDVNRHYHAFLLRQLPPHCRAALDLGCGTGEFARRLAAGSDHVLALDLSPEMVRVAVERSRASPNIEFCVADANAYEFPVEHFDCVASIATLHHLPFSPFLEKCKRALAPGGTLLVLDLVESEGWQDVLTGLAAVPYHALLMLFKTHRLRQPAQVRAAWDQHGVHDSYLRFSQVQQECARTLPGARVRRHLLWRYSIVWKKRA